MTRFVGKVALVTGGSRGIGKAVAFRLGLEGASVAFNYSRDEKDAENVWQELAQAGITCKCYKTDVSSFAEAGRLVENVIADFGKVDVLINNAGICRDNLLVRMTEDQWREVINVNLQSVFNMTRAVVKDCMRKNGGVIVNVTSVMGIRGNTGQANYAAAKAGIIGFTKSAALEFAKRGIRVNAVAPGYIDTRMTDGLTERAKEKWIGAIPMQRSGSADEVAGVCLFLASDDASYVTGQVLQVDGGLRT